ncbi:hypothetical protein [Saccharibacillus brassicae]|uniref:LURP-one-related family protein n=1 Tax=Saccharibacillus brassicae TaxID=2583377 RepID=A0A4Y6V0T1_SACBS|nr:hypothetical protein [Saccharibacillus brassicae]QDH22077.1 hypothetical protein FFV09_15230 [Saccharibacillus brassicae]
MELYFKDNFLSTGVTEIMDDSGTEIGRLDLKSVFSPSVDVYGRSGELFYAGKLETFDLRRRWMVYDANGAEAGELRSKFSFAGRVFEYDAGRRGLYGIQAPFSLEKFSITANDEEIASFANTNKWFSPHAYVLRAPSPRIDLYEWVAVVMGISALLTDGQ